MRSKSHPAPRSWRRRSTALLGALVLASCLLPTVHAQAPAAPSSFSEIGNYILELDGKQVPARFFHSQGLGTILLDVPSLGQRIELDPRARTVNVYPASAFAENPDGTLERTPTARPTAMERFQLVDKLPQFTFDGHSARFLLKPHMLGEFDRAKLLAENPGYGARAKSYTPTDYHLNRLLAVDDEVEVEIYFGSWCGVCFRLMPHVVKLEEALADAPFTFGYYGLPPGFDDPVAKRVGVESVPTAIVYRNGQEVGRLQGYNFSIPEMSLANLLDGVGVPDIGRPPSGR